MKKDRFNIKKIIRNFPKYSHIFFGILSFYSVNKFCYFYRILPGDFFEKIYFLIENPFRIFTGKFISLNGEDLLYSMLVGIIVFALIFARAPKKKFRTGEEHGSAKWADKYEIEKFQDKNFRNNCILTATEGLTMKDYIGDPTNGRNKNILIIGGPGTGKTRFFVLPNLMQMHSSYVITDPKGTILPDIGSLLYRKGHYKIKVLNLVNMKKSMHYNPLAYLHTELDVLKFSEMLVDSTQSKDAKRDFWVDAEKLLYSAVIGLIIFEAPEEEKNMNTLIEIINASKTSEDEGYANAVDMLFEELEQKDPRHFAVRQYKKYKLGAGKSAKSILLSCGVRLSPFDIREIMELMDYDELEIDKLGEEKSALFVITSDTDPSLNFIASFLYTQMFNLLCTKADDEYEGKLPIPVRCIFDEFANLGKIPHFEQLITTIRSRKISACPILQTKSQLKAVYKDSAETIAGGCDSTIFLGGQEKSTLKDMTELLGSQTIDIITSSKTYGNQKSSTTNFQKGNRKLLDEAEIFKIPGEKCILTIRGANPWLSHKYDITKHPNYRYLGSFDKRNKFNVQKYIMKMRSNADFKINDNDTVTEIKENSPMAN